MSQEVPKRGRPKKADDDRATRVRVWLPAPLLKAVQAHARPGEQLSETVQRLLRAATASQD